MAASKKFHTFPIIVKASKYQRGMKVVHGYSPSCKDFADRVSICATFAKEMKLSCGYFIMHFQRVSKKQFQDYLKKNKMELAEGHKL